MVVRLNPPLTRDRAGFLLVTRPTAEHTAPHSELLWCAVSSRGSRERFQGGPRKELFRGANYPPDGNKIVVFVQAASGHTGAQPV